VEDSFVLQGKPYCFYLSSKALHILRVEWCGCYRAVAHRRYSFTT